MKRRQFLLGITLALSGGPAGRQEACSSSKFDAEALLSQTMFNNLNRDVQSMLPVADESRWQTIPWRQNLMAARKEAQSLNKPLFLWIMNGNPMGCT